MPALYLSFLNRLNNRENIVAQYVDDNTNGGMLNLCLFILLVSENAEPSQWFSMLHLYALSTINWIV